MFVTPGGAQVSQNRRIDPDRRWPWVDEMLVGYRRQLPGQMTFDVSVISREYKHRPAQVEVNGIYDGGVFRGYQDVSQNEINLVTKLCSSVSCSSRAMRVRSLTRASRVRLNCRAT